jgi:acetyl esterase/lipase
MFSQQTAIYKTVGSVELALTFFLPGEPKPCPAVIFFFGGGFKSGRVEQFWPQSEYLAERGIAGITADYRVKQRHGVTPSECLQDARDAFAWVRTHAAEYGIDPERIAVAGGSAGGYLAAAMIVRNEAETVPAAAALFNPLFDTTVGAGMLAVPDEERASLNLMDKVRPGCPPMAIFTGELDDGTPLATARRFADDMNSAGNRCILHAYPGEDHGFFNKGQGTLPEDGCFWDTLTKAHEFLAEVFAL